MNPKKKKIHHESKEEENPSRIHRRRKSISKEHNESKEEENPSSIQRSSIQRRRKNCCSKCGT
jgi:hypothetical protein